MTEKWWEADPLADQASSGAADDWWSSDPVATDAMPERLAASEPPPMPRRLSASEPSDAPVAQADQPGRLRTAYSQFGRGAAQVASGTLEAGGLLQARGAQQALDHLDELDAERSAGVDISRQRPSEPMAVPPLYQGLVNEYRASTDPARRSAIRQELADATDPRNRDLYQAGQAVTETAERAFPVNPEHAQEFWAGQVPQGLGSATGFMATGLVGRGIGAGAGASVAAPGAAMGASAQFAEAIDSGATLEDAYRAADLGAAVGLSEAVPITRLLDRIDAGTGGAVRRLVSNVVKQGTEEAIQEAFQGIMDNAIAAGIYDPERGLWDGVGEGAAAGGVVGGILGLLTGVGGRRARGRTEPTQPEEIPLSPEDHESPIPDTLIQQGRAAIENAEDGRSAPIPAQPADGETTADGESLEDITATIRQTMRGEAPRPAAKPAAGDATATNDSTGLASMGSGMAKAMGENLRERLWQEYSGQAQAIDPLATRARREAPGMSRDEFVQWAEAADAGGAPPTRSQPAAEPPSAGLGIGLDAAAAADLSDIRSGLERHQAIVADENARIDRDAQELERADREAAAADADRVAKRIVEEAAKAEPAPTNGQKEADAEAAQQAEAAAQVAAEAQARVEAEADNSDNALSAISGQAGEPEKVPDMRPEPGISGDLPEGWSEASPGGMATSGDPERGGIVDKAIATGEWFAIPNNQDFYRPGGATKLEGFGSRAEAIAAITTPPAPPQDARKPEPAPAAEAGTETAPAAPAGGEGASEAGTIELANGDRIPAIRDGGETFIRSGEQFVQVFPEADGAFYRVGQDYGSSIDDVRAKARRRSAPHTPDRARENGIRSRPYEALAALPDATLADIAKRLKIKSKGVDRNTLIERIVERPSSDRTAAIAAATQDAASSPSARPIRTDTAVTSRGREIPVEYAVIEATDLVASQTDDFGDNPAYPQWLQPRDRSRSASRQQVTEMAANLNPRLLGETPNAGQGAPIVGVDGFVESGNGRVLAIKRAYQGGKADAYREYLEQQGYPVDGMAAPVLVRINRAEMSQQERAAFAREANERDTLSMGAGERAMADAESISDATLELYRGGAVDLAANRPFVRALLEEAVGANERAGMIRSDGSMAQDAIRRIEAALLAKAYGDPDLVASLVEDSDSDIKAIGGALTDVAAAWSKMRSEAGSEAIDPAMDQTAALLEAVKLVQNARRQGRNVAEFVGQTDMFSGSAISPMARAFLGLMFRNKKQWTQPTGRGTLGAYLRFYVDEAMKTAPGVDLLGLPPVKADDILGLLEGKKDGRPEDQGNLLAQSARRPGEGERGDGPRRDERPDEVAGSGRGEATASAGSEGTGPAGSDAAPEEDFDSIFDNALNEQFGQETDGAPTASEGLEPDSGGAGAQDGVGGADVPPRRGRARGGARKGTRATGSGQGAAAGDKRVPGDGAAPVGEGRDPGVRSPEPAPAGEPAGDPDAGGGRKGGRNRPAARRGRKPRAGDAAPTVTESATSAAKNVVMGLDDVTRGLSELFGGGKTIGSGLAFDEDTYRKAVPFFRAGVAHFAEAGADIADMVRALVKHLAGAGMDRAAVERMRPYVQRFVEDVRSGELDPAADATRQQAVDEARDREVDRETKLEAQRAAEKVEVRVGDLDNVRATLPFLQDAQQEDVHKAESRLSQPGKHGFMFTNGTGTGKTYVGLGVIKRYARQGRGNVLVVAPSQPILQDWKTAAEDLGLKVSVLDSTTDAGKGIVATTYANLGENRHLVDRAWDLVVADESHKLSSAQGGNETDALRTLRAITNHPRGRYARADHILRDEVDEIASLNKQIKALNKSDDERDWRQAGTLQTKLDRALAAYKDRRDALLVQFRGEPRGDVTFLSATPFAYDLNVDYGEGYLFDYGEVEGRGYNQPDGRGAFFMQHFGYRMRTGKLTQPEASVNSDVLERAFHEHLKREGSLSGRSLEVEADYERKFVLVEDAIGQKIDEALTFLGEADKGKFRPLLDLVNEKFDYLARMRLLEAIKARRSIPRIRQHLGLGRKVVVFHDYNEGGGINPFVLAPPDKKPGDKADLKALYEEFLRRNPYALTLKFADNRSPIDEITRAFPDAMVYNGTVTPRRRGEIKRQFNEDGSGKDIIIVQSAAGEAGISLHDTTGKHQRVLMNLGMPVRPVTALQEEGRIYRVGQVTNAVFEYLNTGTNWERWTFAQRIAARSSTAENLALGDQARAIRQSFIDAFQQSSSADPAADDGTGGKERDRATNAPISDFERAKTFYYAQGKRSGRRDQREGIDYFATPEPIALKMVEFADIKFGEKVLEPSAGHGAIARFFPEGSIRTVVEPSAELASRAALAAPGARMVTGRFEDLDVGANKFDAIVMNPPFGLGGKTAVDHLAKAVKHLRNGGRIVAIIPTGPAADKRFDAFMDDEERSKNVYMVADMAMPGVMFERAGTSVRTRIVVLEKQADADVSPPSQASRDYSNAETVAELFDRIENAGLAGRSKPSTTEIDVPEDGSVNAGGIEFKLRTNEASKQPFWAEPGKIGRGRFFDVARASERAGGLYDRFDRAFQFKTAEARLQFLQALENPGAQGQAEAAAEPGGEQFDLAETKHSKTGKDLFVATIRDRVERERYTEINAVAKKHGGYYSAFRGKGAVPGFQFPSAEQRAAFVAEITGADAPRYSLRQPVTDTPEFKRLSDFLGSARVARGVLAGLNKSVVNRLKRDAETLSDLLERQPLGPKARGDIDVPGSVVRHVLAVADNEQVRRSIVRLLPIDVVDFLKRQQVSPELLLSDEAVLKDVLAVDAEAPIAASVDKSAPTLLVRSVARIGAEIASLAGRALEAQAAGLASADDTVLGAHDPRINTKSAAFSRWFGKSKVVDQNGEPLVVYHGTAADFEAFGQGDPATEGGSELADAGLNLFFFTNSRSVAEGFAEGSLGRGRERVESVYLSLQKPLVIDADGKGWPKVQEQIMEAARGGEHDGLIIRNMEDGMFETEVSDVFVAFRPEQIKSAFNRGTFDPADPRISYRLTDNAKAKLPALERDLRARLEKLGIADKVALNVVETIRSVEDGVAVDAVGRYDRLLKAIDIATTSSDPAGYLNHEVIHALRDLGLFTKLEWGALTKAAAADSDQVFRIQQAYWGLGLTEDQILEEVVAEQYRAWARAEANRRGGFVGRAFQKVRDFFKALGQALRRAGFAEAEQVFERIESGEIGARPEFRGGATEDAMAKFARRPYEDAPDGLMGFRRSGENKGFAGTRYPHVQPVRVEWADGDVLEDEIKGTNRAHALERARRNWPTAEKVEAIGPGRQATADEMPRFALRHPTPAATALARARGTAGQHVGRPTPLKERIAQWWEESTENLMARSTQAAIDRFHSLQKLERAVAGGSMDRLPADSPIGAFTAAHFAMNESAYMHAAMYAGPPRLDRREGRVAINDSTKGLLEVLEPLDTQEKIEAFEYYAWARRANELKRQGREPAAQSDIDDGLALAREYPEVVQVFDDWTDFNRGVLAFARDSGLITDEAFATYEADAHYVPFYRTEVDSAGRRIESRQGAGGRRSSITGQRSGIRRLKGSDKAVAGIVENMVKNTERLISRSYRNIAAQKAVALMAHASTMTGEPVVKKLRPQWSHQMAPVNFLEKALADAGLDVDFSALSASEKRDMVGVWSMVPPARRMPDGTMAFSAMVDGKVKWFETPDPLLFESLTALAPRQHSLLARILMGTATAPARMLRWGVTNEPTFAIANAIRDTASTFVTYGAGPGHAARVMAKFLKNSAVGSAGALFHGERRGHDRKALEIMMAGGGIGGWWGFGPADVRRRMDARRRDVGVARKSGRAVKRVWEGYQEVLRASEQANRMVLYDELVAKGASKAEAAYQAMDVTNFSARGSNEIIRTLVEMTPFLNARIQGLSRLYRAGRYEQPSSAGGMRSTRAGFLLNGLILTTAAMALYFANYDDEDYADLEGWEKDLYFHVRLPRAVEEATGARWFRIPRPFEVGAIFATLPERGADQLFRLMGSEAKQDEDLATFRESLGRMLTDTFAVAPTHIGKVAMEQWANWNSFLGRKIVPMGEEDLPAPFQYGPETSETAKAIGQATGLSPRRIESLTRELGGTMAAHAMMGLDAAIEAASGNVAPAKRWYEMPVISRFVRGDGAYTRWAERYYRAQGEIDQMVRVINKLEREGADPDFIDSLIPEDFEERRQFFSDTGKALRDIRRATTEVYADDAITPEEKRQELDELRDERTSIYREVRELEGDQQPQ